MRLNIATVYVIIKAVKGLESFNRRYSLPAILLFVLITIVPLGMAVYGYFPSFTALFSDNDALVSIGSSILIACGCSLASVIIALPGAYILATYRFPLKGLVRALCLLCLSYPVEVAVHSLTVIEPVLGLEVQTPAVNMAAALVMMNVPLVVLIVSSYWATMDDGIRESARTLGIRKSHIFRTITLPYIRCALRGSAALVFIRCLIYVLGTEPVLSFIVSLVALGVFCSAFFGRRNDTATAVRQNPVRIRGFATHLFVFIYCLALTCINLAGPTAAKFSAVFTEGYFTVEPVMVLFADVSASGTVAVIHICTVAVPCAIIAMLIASRIVFAVKYMEFPLFPAMIVFASGYSMVSAGYSLISDLYPVIPLRLPEFLSETAFMIPISVLVILPRARSIDPGYRSISATLGFKAGTSYRKTESRLLLATETAAVLISAAIGTMGYSAYIFEVQGLSALTPVLTAICFILLLAGSRLLRKVA